jgi:hypothetical protein
LKNSLDLLRIPNLLSYGIGKIKQWIRYKTPIQRLWLAEQTTLYIEWEYAYMHFVVSIVLTFSYFSPVVLPIGLLYFLYKYFVDRTIILDAYSHRKNNSVLGAALGLKSDYLAHQRMVILNVQVMLGNMLVFCAFQAMFYGAKIVGDARFIPHTCITAVCGFICLVAIPLSSNIIWLLRKRHIKKVNYKGKKESEVIISSKVAQNWYEPSTSFHYIPPIPQKDSSYVSKV